MSLQLDAVQSQACPRTAGPVWFDVDGGPNFGPYGFWALSEMPVRWAPSASAGENSYVTLPFWSTSNPGGPLPWVSPTTSTMRPLTTPVGNGPVPIWSTCSDMPTADSR